MLAVNVHGVTFVPRLEFFVPGMRRLYQRDAPGVIDRTRDYGGVGHGAPFGIG
jgi:hypothetical protein